MTKRKNSQLILCAVLICSGCLWQACEDDAPTRVSERGYCGDVQCDADEYCVKNACVKRADIDDIEHVDLCESLKCDSGYRCVKGECEKISEKPDGVKCGGVVCGNDEECVDEECVKKTNPAGEKCGDTNCKTDEVCIDEQCVNHSNEEDDPCKSMHCDEGMRCDGGHCVSDSTDITEGTCGGNDCKDDEICENEQCVVKTSDPDEDLCGTEVCAAPLICKEGSCVEDTRVVCGDFICEEGQICNVNQECSEDVECEGDNCQIPDEPEEPGEPVESEKCGNIVCKDGQSCVDGSCVDDYTPVVCGSEICTGDLVCDEDTKTCIEQEEYDPVDDVPVVPDVIAGAFVVSPKSGVTTRRSGRKAQINIKLNQKPTKTVTVPVKSLSTKYGTVSPASVQFTTENWSEYATVVVTGTTDQTLEDKTYNIQIGPISGDEATFKNAPSVTVKVTHIDDIVKDGDCSGGKKKDDAGKCISKQVTGIKLSSSSIRLFRDAEATVTATVQPSDASNKDLEWTLVSNSRKDEDPGKIVTLNDKNGTATVTNKSKGGRTITVRVSSKSNKSVSKEFKVNVKPYVKAKFGKDSGNDYRDYHFTKGGKGDLKCGLYGTDSAVIFNKDMYTYYVEPKMVKGSNGKKYGSRASVVAAARFLTLNFPYDIPYYMGTISKTSQATRSHYIWTKNGDTKASDVNSVRIYGLNLVEKVYNSYESKSGKYSEGKGDVIKEDATVWGCTFGTNDTYNGLECSGFVTWAFRNGHLSLGDWKTHIFAKEGKCTKGDKRNFRCSSYVNGLNPNNTHESAYTKLNKLDSSDFLEFGNISAAEQKKIKAGDLVWHGTNGGKLRSGHVAMILGIRRNDDKTIKDIYIAEATGGNSDKTKVGNRSGNSVRHFTWSDFMKSTAWVGKGSYIIKMGKVYNYYTDYSSSTKQYFDNQKDEDGNPIHGDSFGYHDMW